MKRYATYVGWFVVGLVAIVVIIFSVDHISSLPDTPIKADWGIAKDSPIR